MSNALIAVVAMLLASGALVTVRLVRGPSTLDRAVALDALAAVVMADLAVLTAARQIPYYLPGLLVLSFLGFTGSVSIARFLALRDEATGEGPGGGSGDRTDDGQDDGQHGTADERRRR